MPLRQTAQFLRANTPLSQLKFQKEASKIEEFEKLEERLLLPVVVEEVEEAVAGAAFLRAVVLFFEEGAGLVFRSELG